MWGLSGTGDNNPQLHICPPHDPQSPQKLEPGPASAHYEPSGQIDSTSRPLHMTVKAPNKGIEWVKLMSFKNVHIMSNWIASYILVCTSPLILEKVSSSQICDPVNKAIPQWFIGRYQNLSKLVMRESGLMYFILFKLQQDDEATS